MRDEAGNLRHDLTYPRLSAELGGSRGRSLHFFPFSYLHGRDLGQGGEPFPNAGPIFAFEEKMNQIDRLAADDLRAFIRVGFAEAELSIERKDGAVRCDGADAQFGNIKRSESEIKGKDRTGNGREHVRPNYPAA